MAEFSAAIVTVSDTRSAGARKDETTSSLTDVLTGAGMEVAETVLVPDELNDIALLLADLSERVDLVLTSGGTGLGPRDVTPEATRAVIEREAPGFAELMRAETAKVTPKAYLSRAVVGQRGSCLIVNLPGSPKGARECLEVLLPLLPHALGVAQGDGH